MSRTIKFHLDEHVSPGIAASLRRHGVDVSTTLDANLGGAVDEEHVAFALAESRVIVTKDDDYLRLNARGINHSGVAYWQQNTRSIGQVVSGLLLIWEVMDLEEMQNHVEFL